LLGNLFAAPVFGFGYGVAQSDDKGIKFVGNILMYLASAGSYVAIIHVVKTACDKYRYWKDRDNYLLRHGQKVVASSENKHV